MPSVIGGSAALELRSMVAYTREHGRGGAPFDFVTIGQTRSPRDTGNVAAVAEAGATWWLEYIFTWGTSLEATRARIHRGPPRP
jgi:hypothetical protein